MSYEIGPEFMKKTGYKFAEASDQYRGLPQPALELEYDTGAALIDLPRPADIDVPALDLRQAIEERTSLRRYASDPLSLAELSYLLWCTQGVKQATGRPATLRTVPSAGARHAFETYMLINNVTGLEPGLYRFLAMEHKLLPLEAGADVADRITEAAWRQKMVKNSAATFLWVAVTYRMTWRYGQRGYRYLHLDAGHVCQNLYLAAQQVGCGTCAIAAFEYDSLNHALGLDGKEQFVIYLATVGKRTD